MTSSSTLSGEELVDVVELAGEVAGVEELDDSDCAVFESPPEQAASAPATKTASSPVLRIGERFAAMRGESLHVSAFQPSATGASGFSTQ